MKQQKTLYILRHAKAETAKSGQEDRDRRLTARGAEDAGNMGKYLAAQGIKPELVLCSTSIRTRETLAGLPFKAEFTDKLYHASAGELLHLIAATPETVHSLMLIGHNPGLHELALKLAASSELAGFPTCALATIVFEGKWRDIGRARGMLTGFITPKIL